MNGAVRRVRPQVLFIHDGSPVSPPLRLALIPREGEVVVLENEAWLVKQVHHEVYRGVPMGQEDEAPGQDS